MNNSEFRKFLRGKKKKKVRKIKMKKLYKNIINKEKIEKVDNIIEIYTDGSYSGRRDKGGWAFVVLNGGKICRCESGCEYTTTSNRMEITAALMALKYVNLKLPCSNICIYSDSKYLVMGANEWAKKWRSNLWVTDTQGPAKNVDLWEVILNNKDKSNIRFVWIKGHAGNTYNEIADTMATYEVYGNEKPSRQGE